MNYGLLLASTGEWKIIKTPYSPGIIDCHTEQGKGFTLLVVPFSFINSCRQITKSNILSYFD